MRNFKKKIVTDETMRPVAVLIDYQDWQEIEKLLAACELKVEEQKVDLAEYAGTIKLSIDPLEYQQQIRDEW
ncbi:MULTISPECIES: hypothetical protein [Okeania]|uniref:Uncharacterized protein n=1 Tax=Okeania hirsuta TaxID=1458930 RepID=A0A3N6QS15_9CYAN|nr:MULTISPECIES: hypothetical protein [Okeania]NES79996.1 hypothetical protein [Okeania sp. SIO1H4]NES92894.1 hypothetical protein [Okeania sp. SIO2B9]NET23800.1 hypothetical protein [Okeania sp. SIO1H5]NET80401.1 hypothetical protein [Okeania sp. SIO1F9]NET97583.1 hypothetical protein [Okeania sp. SIO1H2]